MRLRRHCTRHPNGRISTESFYLGDGYEANSSMGKTTIFGQDGNPKTETSFRNGMYHGRWKLYSDTFMAPDGRPLVMATTTYWDGKIHGEYAQFSTAGEQTSSSYYHHGDLHGATWYLDEDGTKTISLYSRGELVHGRYHWDEDIMATIDDLLNPTDVERMWFTLKYGEDLWSTRKTNLPK